MPRFSKHNDAVRYDKRKWQTYTAKQFNDLYNAVKASSGYRMIVWDSFGSTFNKDAIVKINVEGEWNK